MHKKFELLFHFIRLLMKLITPGGTKALIAENLALRAVHEITSGFGLRYIPPGVVAKTRRRPAMPSFLRL
ncbi:MAG: hypothetical protein P8Y45_24795, partial [Exilibacterium sp.]